MPEMKVHANGIDFNVLVEGREDGLPVLLLHGFPDSLKLWRHLVPYLVRAGYRVIAMDQRGFGLTDAPAATDAYLVGEIVNDAAAVVSELGVREKIRLVGHDWGALIGWQFCFQHPSWVDRYVAVSVGHPLAFRRAGFEQKCKSWYVLAFQFRGIAEYCLKFNNWVLFRALCKNHPELVNWISDLSRPGRLTAALNWYRANFMGFLAAKNIPNCKVRTLGVYSPGDIALTEKQMLDSVNFMDAEWRYRRVERCGHWIPLEQPQELAEHILDWFKD